MFKQLLFTALSLCLASMVPALAENIQFICRNEASANAIALAVVKTHTYADELTRRRLMHGKCWTLDKKAFVYVVHRGTTFGTTFKLTVVGLSREMGVLPEMWSVMPTIELQGDGTI